MSGAIPPSPLYVFMAWTGKTLLPCIILPIQVHQWLSLLSNGSTGCSLWGTNCILCMCHADWLWAFGGLNKLTMKSRYCRISRDFTWACTSDAQLDRPYQEVKITHSECRTRNNPHTWRAGPWPIPLCETRHEESNIRTWNLISCSVRRRYSGRSVSEGTFDAFRTPCMESNHESSVFQFLARLPLIYISRVSVYINDIYIYIYIYIYKKVKVKQSHYRPGQAQRIPGS